MLTVAPCRVMDTRNPNGTFGGPFISGGTSRAIPIPSSACGVPANAMAYSLNFTVVPRTGKLGSLTVWPTGRVQPNVSTLTSPDGSVLADAALVPAGTAGSINAYSTDDAGLVVDINGYFVPPATSTLQFYPLPPCRILDTRNADGTFSGPSLAGGGNGRSFPIPSSSCGAPANAAAYSFNVTVVPQGYLGYLTAWPTGQAQPLVRSTMNSWDGTVIANRIVPAGSAGAVSFSRQPDHRPRGRYQRLFRAAGNRRTQLLRGDPVPAGGYAQRERRSWWPFPGRRHHTELSSAGRLLWATGQPGGSGVLAEYDGLSAGLSRLLHGRVAGNAARGVHAQCMERSCSSERGARSGGRQRLDKRVRDKYNRFDHRHRRLAFGP